MRAIKFVEMASTRNIHKVTLGGKLETKMSPEGDGFAIFEDGEEIDWIPAEEVARAIIARYAIDEELMIDGRGTYAGRRYWQLPRDIQKQVLDIAKSDTPETTP